MPDPIDGTPCIFCGGDRSAPDHDQYCDGRQGGVEPDDPPTESADDDPNVRIQRHRETSVRAFYNAVDAGMIKTRREQVWAALVALGPATIKEVDLYLRRDQHLAVTVWSVGPRFAELRDLGLIREVGKRPCRVTGSIVITWEAVPSDQHRGFATVHRCPTCGQVIARDLPTRKAS